MSVSAPLNGEPLLPLCQAARLLPGHRGAAGLNPSTLGRWIEKGMPAKGGGRVKLEAVRFGHRWLTSAAALARFAAALTASHAAPPPAQHVPSPTARRRAAQALKAAGA